MAVAVRTQRSRRQTSPKRGRRILVVDDDESTRAYLVALLEGRGYGALEASSGEQALEFFDAGVAPDLVLLDIILPHIDGFETLRRMRARGVGTPVLMLSGLAESGIVVKAMRGGACGYLVKPFEEAELDDLLRQVFGSPDAGEAAAEGAVWCGAAMREVRGAIDRIADTDVNVLIQGETGVGKEIVAREIHQSSGRARKPFVKVHCAALPEPLLESELFGYKKGAFTGAWDSKPGKFELADGGSVFLDEIGEMSPALQAKLLHVLQDGSFARVGGHSERKVDVRVLCATHRSLERMMEEGTFRRDLFFRINVVTLQIPPLRDRPDEISLLLEAFLTRYSSKYGKPVPPVSPALWQALGRYYFPGNVRELENMAKRLVVLRNGDALLDELRRGEASARVATAALARVMDELEASAGRVPLLEVGRRAATEAEYHVLKWALATTDWNRKKAARLLNVSYSTLLQKIRSSGLRAAGDRTVH